MPKSSRLLGSREEADIDRQAEKEEESEEESAVESHR